MALQHRHPLAISIVLFLVRSFSAGENADINGSIIYPAANAQLTFNYLDRVKISYTSQWPAGVNLWVFCHLSTNSPWAHYYQTYYNPLTQSGIYTIEQIGNPSDLHGILEFPTPCWFKAANASLGITDPDNVPGILGGNFTMKSVDAVVQQTWAANATAPAAATSAASTSSHASAPAATTVASGHASPPSTHLDKGVKAGIGIGVGVVGLALVSLVLYVLVLQRRLRERSDSLDTLKAMQQNHRRNSRANAWTGLARNELDASISTLTAATRPRFEMDDGRVLGAELPVPER